MSVRMLAAISFLFAIAFGSRPGLAQLSETLEDDRLTMESGDDDQEAELDHPVRSSDQDRMLGNAVAHIVKRANQFRQSRDLSPVQRNEQLQQAAVDFARYMARTNRYGHRANGQTPAQRAREDGYDHCQIAENIAYYFDSSELDAEALAEQFMTGWIESQGHRENLLLQSATQTGVAVAQDEKTGYYFAVQMLGRPRSEAVEFKVVNQTGEEVAYSVVGKQSERAFSLPPRAIMTHTRCLPPQLRLEREGAEPMAVKGGQRYVIAENQEQLSLQAIDDQATVEAQ